MRIATLSGVAAIRLLNISTRVLPGTTDIACLLLRRRPAGRAPPVEEPMIFSTIMVARARKWHAVSNLRWQEHYSVSASVGS